MHARIEVIRCAQRRARACVRRAAVRCSRAARRRATARRSKTAALRGATPARAGRGRDAPTGGRAAGRRRAKPLPGAENAGKPGYYTVKPGDTMIRIGLETGQNWRDIVRWNNLDNPNVIEVGQVLRVVAARRRRRSALRRAASRPPRSRRARSTPAAAAAGRDAGRAAPPPAPPASAPAPAAAPPPARTAPRRRRSAREGDDDVNWTWPATGPVVASFDEARNKGLAIAGKAGDPVLAAADGRVVYAGSGLRGYGNLVIVKHNNTYLTAYAHNQTLLVKEDQAGAARAEDRRDGLERRRPRATAFRDPQAGQAGRSRRDCCRRAEQRMHRRSTA